MIFNLTPPAESTAVEFIEQALTDTQKAQARTNIGALDSSSLVSTLTMLGYTKVATGSYVGDKTGTAYLTDSLTVQRYSPRTISLPFTPNVILLIEKSTDSVTVIAPAVAKYASVQYYRTSAPSTFVRDVSAPINLAYIDGNSLSLIGTIAAGTTISRIQQWYGFFDSASEATSVYEGGSFNESGYTYYYLAF